MDTRFLLLSLILGAMPLCMDAQDDVYFTPKKRAKTDITYIMKKRKSVVLPTIVAAIVTLTSIIVVAN